MAKAKEANLDPPARDIVGRTLETLFPLMALGRNHFSCLEDFSCLHA